MKKINKYISFIITIVLLITAFPLQTFAFSHNWVLDENSSNEHTKIYNCSVCDNTRSVIDHGEVQTIKAKDYYPDLSLDNNNGGNIDILTCDYCKNNNYENEFEGAYYFDTSTWEYDTEQNVTVTKKLLDESHYYIIFKVNAGSLNISSDNLYIDRNANEQLIYIQGDELCLDISDDDKNYTDDVNDIDTAKPYYALISYLSTGDSDVDYSLTVVKSQCNHKYEYVKTVDATCQQEGYDLYRCSKCNNETKKNITRKSDHKRGEWTVEKQPTCKEKGLKVRRCTVCGEIVDRDTISTNDNHKWDEGNITVQPTCTTDGEKTYTCAVCGQTYKEAIPRQHHFAIESNKDTDCFLDYTVKFKCVDCGYEQETIVSGHQWKQNKVITEATCNNIGEVEYKCVNCGATKVAYTAKLTHKYVLKYTENDCEHGYNTYVCDICGDCYIEPLSIKKHQFVITSSDAYRINYNCKICGYQKTLPNDKYYTWDKGLVIQEPSCTQVGITQYTSIINNQKYTMNVQTSGKLPHMYKYVYNDGIEKRICTNCGYEEILSCKHNYIYISNNDETHTVKCTKCGNEYTEKCDIINSYGDCSCRYCDYHTYKPPTYTTVKTRIYTEFGYDNHAGGVIEAGVPIDDFGTIIVNGVESAVINNKGEFADKSGKEYPESNQNTYTTKVNNPNDCKVEIRINLNRTYRAYRIENVEITVPQADWDSTVNIRHISQDDLINNGNGSYSLFLTKEDYNYYGMTSIKVSFCCDYINRQLNINLIDDAGNPVYTEINGKKYNYISSTLGLYTNYDIFNYAVKYYTLMSVKCDLPDKYVEHYNLTDNPKYAFEIKNVTNRDVNVTYVYRRNRCNINVKYIDKETGNELKPAYIKEIEQGSEVNIEELTSINIDGYEILSIMGDTNSFIDADRDIIVYYEINKESTPEIKPIKPDKAKDTMTRTTDNYKVKQVDTGITYSFLISFLLVLIGVIIINFKKTNN